MNISYEIIKKKLSYCALENFVQECINYLSIIQKSAKKCIPWCWYFPQPEIPPSLHLFDSTVHSPDHLLSSCLGPKEEQGCTLASDSFHTDQQQCADDQPDKNFTFFLTVWITVSISATKQLTTMQVGREVQFKFDYLDHYKTQTKYIKHLILAPNSESEIE